MRRILPMEQIVSMALIILRDNTQVDINKVVQRGRFFALGR
jgi:hypothetical protein